MTSPDPAIVKPNYWDAAVAHLMRRDRILKKIIPQYPEVWLISRGTPFVTLARAIVGQQISIKAADAIWQRLTEQCGKRLSAVAVVNTSVETLRAVGLSQRKVEYLHDLALHFHERRVHPTRWVDMEDEQIIAERFARVRLNGSRDLFHVQVF